MCVTQRDSEMQPITLQPNTVRHRGLPTTLDGHIAMIKVIDDLSKIGGVEVFKGAHCASLETISWFLYGIKPKISGAQ